MFLFVSNVGVSAVFFSYTSWII